MYYIICGEMTKHMQQSLWINMYIRNIDIIFITIDNEIRTSKLNRFISFPQSAD